MITHPGARTRALYIWENDDLDRRLPARMRFVNRRNISRIVRKFKYRVAPPSVRITQSKGHPYCLGWKEIMLTMQNRRKNTLVHELTHARGFGSLDNPHSVGFVRAYIDALARAFGWDADELQLQAHMRGLL